MAEWIRLGEYTDDWGEKVPVGLPMKDLMVHASVLGTTGSGKSTFLRNLAVQAFLLGSHVVVIEPHGDLILGNPGKGRNEGIVAAIPDQYMDRIMVVSPASPWPVQVNLATVGLGGELDVAVDSVMNTIRVVESASWDTAIDMREKLESVLYLMLDVYGHDASMTLFHRLFTDYRFLRRTINKASESVSVQRDKISGLLDRIEAQLAKGRPVNDFKVLLRRIEKFLTSPRFRRSLSLPNLGVEINMGRSVNAKEANMVLVPLLGAELGEEGKRVFGTLFMQMTGSALMARGSTGGERRQVIIILDEFADMAGGAVGDIVKMLLAQARKFGASLILATQSISQLPPDVQAEVKGNTNVKIILLTSGDADARIAAQTLGGGLTPEDIMGIQRFHGYARVIVNKQPQSPFYFKSLTPFYPQQKMVFGQANAGVVFPKALKQLHEIALEDKEKAILLLTGANQEQFDALLQMQIDFARKMAEAIQNDPTYRPDPVIAKEIYYTIPRDEKVKRTLAISACKYGLPDWFGEAAFRRIRS
jgi:hypothetical protein